MAQFSVTFQLEAATLEEAEAAIATWVVTPDTTLTSISGVVWSTRAPIIIADGGAVADGEQLQAPEPPAAVMSEPKPEAEE
jgi:hypothetical protein